MNTEKASYSLADTVNAPAQVVIPPAVGRKLWYRPCKADGLGPVPMTWSHGQPLDATVVAVWGNRMVNVLVLDTYGRAFPKLSVTLRQPGDEPVAVDDDGLPLAGYVEWMPYQVATAGRG